MAAQTKPALKILRRKQVEARTGLSRSTIYAKMRRNPKRPPVDDEHLDSLDVKANNDVCVKSDSHAVLQELAKLPLGEYESRRVESAQSLGWRVSFLDAEVEKLRPKTDSDDKGSSDDAKQIIEIICGKCDFFHNPDREPYVTFENKGHRECWHVQSRGFEEWLSYQYFSMKGKAFSESVLKAVMATLVGKAKFDGDEKKVHLRVAGSAGDYWIDFCNDQWQAVNITPTGWTVVDNPPVMFSRSSSMRALPTPTTGGPDHPGGGGILPSCVRRGL